MKYLRNLAKTHSVRKLQSDAIAHHRIEEVRILPTPKPDDIICIMVTRDEAFRLPDCIRHYRELGVNRFAIIDNKSVDETRQVLLDQSDVDVFSTEDSYAEARSGTYWHNRLAERYGFNRWYLIIDPDELLVYTGMERHNLHDLRAFLERWKAQAFVAPMIDMYSKAPLDQIEYRPGDRMVDACRYFDGTSYEQKKSGPFITSLSGGPRTRMLREGETAFTHSLNKCPFFYWGRTVFRKNIHNFSVHRRRHAPSGALLHFKFLPDFAMKVDAAVQQAQHWNGAVQYKVYREALAEGKLQSPFYDGSIEYGGPDSLLMAGLINRINWHSPRPTRSAFKSLISGRPLMSALPVLER